MYPFPISLFVTHHIFVLTTLHIKCNLLFCIFLERKTNCTFRMLRRITNNPNTTGNLEFNSLDPFTPRTFHF